MLSALVSMVMPESAVDRWHMGMAMEEIREAHAHTSSCAQTYTGPCLQYKFKMETVMGLTLHNGAQVSTNQEDARGVVAKCAPVQWA